MTIDRAALRRLCELATPGSWIVGLREAVMVLSEQDEGIKTEGFVASLLDDSIQAERDAAFISAARTAVPELLDLIDQLEAERDLYKQQLEASREVELCNQDVRDERDAATRRYFNLADAVAARSDSPEQLCAIARQTRAERDQWKAVVKTSPCFGDHSSKDCSEVGMDTQLPFPVADWCPRCTALAKCK